MMTLNKTLTVTMEECGKLTRACAKVVRHGMDKDPKYRNNLMEELADVQAMIHLVVSAASFSPDYIEKLVDKRLEKMVNPHYE